MKEVIDHAPRRIVSLQPSATVILAGLGELERVVACTKYCVDVCPEVAGRCTIVADSWSAQADQILAAKPDLVIAAVPYQQEAVAQILKAGVRFLGLAPKTLADIYTDMATIAGTAGRSDQGEQLIRLMQKEIESVSAQSRELRRPRVYCEEWGKPLIASQAWVAELVEAAGGEFVGEPGSQTMPEALLRADPQVVVAAWCGAGDRVPLEKIVRDRGWEKMRAAVDGRVYCLRDEWLNTPAPTLIQGLHALAAAIHPQRFPQVPGLRCISQPQAPDKPGLR